MAFLFVFDPQRLRDRAIELRGAYAQAQPFPHVVIDDLLPAEVARAVTAEFPKPQQTEWLSYDDPAEKKLACNAETQMGEMTRLLLYQFNSSVFITFLEALTGIDGLIPDPHYWGGGLHQTPRGGFLKVHADFNLNDRLRVDRRLSLVFYLNDGWQEEYGGHLELWNRSMSRCEKKILPVLNRCVVFNTTDSSYHGHPDPVTCPQGETRKSLALYYYTNGRPRGESSGRHSTLFQNRPGEKIGWSPKLLQLKAIDLVGRLTPPILLDSLYRLRQRSRRLE